MNQEPCQKTRHFSDFFGNPRTKVLGSVLAGLALSFAPPAPAAALPDSDFVLDAAVHKTTGLIWKRCVEGQTWTGSTCSGDARLYTWNEAMALGGDGWAMPTLDQLKSIIDLSRSYPSPLINTTAFPNAPSSLIVWSASPDAGNSANAKLINFSYAGDISYAKTYRIAVRLVRSAQTSGAAASPSVQPTLTPDSDFLLDTVLHKTTGLIWKRCVEGQTWTGSTCSGNVKRYTWYQAMALGTDGWGMPSLEQLKTIVDNTQPGYPLINRTVFPNMPNSSNFFTATTDPDPRLNYGVRTVNFATGLSDFDNKDDPSNVRLVRGGLTTATTREPATAFPLSDTDHIFNYLESQYPQYLAPAKAVTATASGYEYRYYPSTQSYVGASNGKLYFLGPASANALVEMGTVSDWLVTASKAGY